MDALHQYFAIIGQLLEQIQENQQTAMRDAAELLAKTVENRGNIYAFGCSHAGILADELCYRTGGMATINAVHAPGLHLDITPLPMSSQIERLPQYGALIADGLKLKQGDLVIIHSVSGRNTVTVDFALQSRKLGASIIALTSVAYSSSVSSRHPSGQKLMDVCDVLLDNGAPVGDAAVSIPGLPENVSPVSTVTGAAILNAVVAQAVSIVVEKGIRPPVFISANVEGGDDHNAKMLDEYHEQIFYM